MENVQINNTSEREIIRIKRLFWIWYSDFISLEQISRHGEWRAGKMNLQSGINPTPFNVDVTEWTPEETGKDGPHGIAMGMQLQGLFVKWNEFCESYFNEMQRRPMVVFYEDFDGRTWILGGENCKTKFNFSKAIAPRAGYQIIFSNMSDESSIIIADTDFFPAPPAVNSGNPPPTEITSSITDRYGIVLPDTLITEANPDVNYNEIDFTALALSRESNWGGFETDLQNATDALITLGTWKKLIAWYPNAYNNANCHRWNFRYPFDYNQAHRMLFTTTSHSAAGIGNFDGFHWAFPNINMQSFTNTYNMAIGVTLTSDLGTSLGSNKQIFNATENTGVSANLQINTTTGNIDYTLMDGSATYVPGAPEADYTGKRYVVWRDGANLKLYIDGMLVQTTTPTFNLQVSSYTINSTVSFGGQGSASKAAECTIGNIWFGTDLTGAEIASQDAIIATLETAIR